MNIKSLIIPNSYSSNLGASILDCTLNASSAEILPLEHLAAFAFVEQSQSPPRSIGLGRREQIRAPGPEISATTVSSCRVMSMSQFSKKYSRNFEGRKYDQFESQKH